VIQSLLTRPGFDHAAYARRFGTSSQSDFPQLRELVALGLAEDDGQLLGLTPRGVAFSDSIGPWLVSPAVRARMQQAPC
jgi:oxygen-independent coproporphyrinogen-3 oxidase